MTPFEVVRDIILLLLGITGTILSIYNYVQAERRDKRLLKVTMTTVTPVYTNGSLGPPYAKVEATNIGHRAVTITSLGIELPGGVAFARFQADAFPGVPDSSLPMTLDDGQSGYVHYAYSDLGAALIQSGLRDKVKLTSYAEDSTGNRHRGQHWGNGWCGPDCDGRSKTPPCNVH